MVLRGNHKPYHSDMNSAALEKIISKEVNHGWALNLTVTLLQSFNNSGVVPLGVVEQLSIKKGRLLYQMAHYPQLFIPGSFRPIHK